MGEDRPQSPPCPRILIVEDDPDQRVLIAEALDMYFEDTDGRQIKGIGSGAEFRHVDPAMFDVILMDYNLPDSNGLELLDQVKLRSDVPVIFVTGENIVETASEAIRRGAQDYVIKLGDYLFTIPLLVEKNIRQHQTRRENKRLQAQLEASIEEVRVKNLQLEEALAEQERMAATDYLTALANRRHFGQLLESTFSEATRYQFDLTCIMIDLDHYKVLNDTLGHQMGDRILITTARVIQDNLRASDVAARYGGDEFVLLLPHTSVELALTVADRIRRQLAKTGQQYLKIGRPLTMSMGLSNLKFDKPANADGLVAMADKDLYAAKDAGKNRVMTYQDMAQTASR